MHAANVNNEFAVDKDPHVVVARERKGLCSVVQELGMHGHAEIEVVSERTVLVVVAPTTLVQRKEPLRRTTIELEEARTWASLIEDELPRDRNRVLGRSAEPVIKVRLASHKVTVGVNGPTVRAVLAVAKGRWKGVRWEILPTRRPRAQLRVPTSRVLRATAKDRVAIRTNVIHDNAQATTATRAGAISLHVHHILRMIPEHSVECHGASDLAADTEDAERRDDDDNSSH
eukprot:Amastigsp_a206_482.p2 type:complete len:230 gc:universal Amastigsp_a206_482:727-38(-)